jgi:hypothetical protein
MIDRTELHPAAAGPGQAGEGRESMTKAVAS